MPVTIPTVFDTNTLRTLSVDSPTLIIDETNNRVGIGTLTPGKSLHIRATGTQRVLVESTNNQAGIELKSDSSNGVVIYSPDSSDDLNFNVGGSDKVVFSSAGNIQAEGSIFLKEKADAASDAAAYGQIWVNTATPNELYFTDDAGTDVQLGASGSGATALNGLSDVSYSSGDLVVTSLDTLTTSATAHNAAGTALKIASGNTTAGTTNNIAGGDLTIVGGQGKGTGVGGDIIFQTAKPGTSGSSLNSLVTVLTITDDGAAVFVGGQVLSYLPKAVDYTLLVGDHVIGVDTLTGTTARTMTLPENAAAGTTYVIKDVGGGAGTYNITISKTGSDTIDGQTTQVINSNYASVTLVSDGANWFIV